MSLSTNNSPPPRRAATRWLQRVGAIGSVLALAILGASMLLRLSTVFALDGHTLSTLPAGTEAAVRMLHRVSASGVALLALGAIALCWKLRRSHAHLAWPVAWVVAATSVLAVIGPLTPGYKVGAITVANVSVGMVLLMAFWWLRESAAGAASSRHRVDAFSWSALLAFLAHVATGAAASAGHMHGLRWPAFVHLGSLLLALILIMAVLLGWRHRAELAPARAAVAGLLGAQFAVGYVLMWQNGPAPVGLAFVHAMLSPLLALALVSLLHRGKPA